MVKTSYYPNWEVEGADGPVAGHARTSWWSSRPSKHVELDLRHDRRPPSRLGRGCSTVVGVVGLARPGVVGRWPTPAIRRSPESGRGGARRVRFPSRSTAVRTRGSRARRCARHHLQGLRRSRDLSRRDRRVDRRGGSATRSSAFTGAARVLVGRDARPSSEPLVAAFIEGATVAGADVVDLGARVHRPLLLRGRAASTRPAAMFTASHNPAAVQRRSSCAGPARAPIGEDTGLRRDQGDGRGRAARAGRGPGPGRARATCCPRSSRTCTRSSTSTRSRRCGSSPTPPTASVG